MKKLTGLWVGVFLLLSGASTLAAQEQAGGMTGPPKVLVIQREVIKPGRSGSMHLKTESAFVDAMTAAKWPTHYLGMDSLSGPSRALFFVGYDSFADWEKDNWAMRKNATLSAAFDRASIADGDLLTEFTSAAFVYREDMSFHAPVNIAQMRYMEISRFVVKPGHMHDWDALVKMYVDGYGKAVPNAHWATYQSQYGTDNSNVFLVIIPMKSLSEVDAGLGDAAKFAGSMGESEMRKLGELTAASIQASATNLFEFNPKMSYVPEAWVSADPSFWKPAKSAPPKRGAAAAKPAQ